MFGLISFRSISPFTTLLVAKAIKGLWDIRYEWHSISAFGFGNQLGRVCRREQAIEHDLCYLAVLCTGRVDYTSVQ